MGLVRMTTATAKVRAILLALALVLQGLVPAAAFAHDEARGPATLEICTGEGVKHVHAAQHGHHGFAGLACEQCVMASLAMVAAAPPPLRIRSQPVSFLYRPAAERPSTQPRAPPRPPSQGPPISA
jgi:hypothetical protein